MSLSADLAARLTAAGLDPAASSRLVRAALAEDLAGGVDVTSAATVPADQVASGGLRRAGRRCRRRAAGRRGGLRGASARIRGRRRRFVAVVGDGDRGRRAATCSRPSTGPHPRPAHRRAHRAEPALPPVRRRDPDPALGRRGRGHRRRRPRHPQDDARPARAGEVRGALRRRGQPPDVAVGRRAGQGQPRRRGRRRGRGVRRRARRCGPACRSRSRSTPSTSCDEVLDAGRRPGAARQHGRRHDARGRRRRRPAGPGWRRQRRAARSTTRRAVAATGVDYLRSARSPTRRPCSTSAWTCASLGPAGRP